MEKVNAFKLSDGRLVESEKYAARLQKQIDLKKAVQGFAHDLPLPFDQRDVIQRAILDNSDKLYQILKLALEEEGEFSYKQVCECYKNT